MKDFEKLEYNEYPDEIHFFPDGAITKVFRPSNPDPQRQALTRQRINDKLCMIQKNYEVRQVKKYLKENGNENLYGSGM